MTDPHDTDFGPHWTNNGGVEPVSYSLTTGPGSIADVDEEGGSFRISINNRFPSIGYDGKEFESLEEAMLHVNEWWSVAEHLVFARFDQADHPGIEQEAEELRDALLVSTTERYL